MSCCAAITAKFEQDISLQICHVTLIIMSIVKFYTSVLQNFNAKFACFTVSKDAK